MLMAQTLKLVCTIWLGEEYGTWQVECQLSQSSANTYRQHKGSNCEQNKILPDAAREVTVSRAAVKMFGGLGHMSCGESSCLKLTFWREKQLYRMSVSGSKYWQDYGQFISVHQSTHAPMKFWGREGALVFLSDLALDF